MVTYPWYQFHIIFQTVYQHLRSKGIQNYLNQKMPKISVPEIATWLEPDDGVMAQQETNSKIENLIASKSYWILGGGIVLFLLSLVLVSLFGILCW